jgi:hypothetical protein
MTAIVSMFLMWRRASYHPARMSGYLSFLARLAFLAMGCGLVLRAGRLEAEGRLVEAQRGARQGGFLAALGSLLGAAGAAALPETPGRTRGLVAALILTSGAAALLAGLSGKPRPTGWAAVALLVAGAVVALLAVR